MTDRFLICLNNNISMFQFHFLPFIFAFICGIIYMIAVSILEERQTISKTPTPFSKNHLYTDIDGECYRVDVQEVKCKGDEKLYKFD